MGEGLWSRYFVVTDGIETEPPIISRANCPTADTLRESRLCQQCSSKFGAARPISALRGLSRCFAHLLNAPLATASLVFGTKRADAMVNSSRGEHGRTLVAASLLTDLLTQVSEPRNGKGRNTLS